MSKRKGVALPINMLVILAVAVIVLLAVVAFFMGGFETGPVDRQTMISQCCSSVVTFNQCAESDWSNVIGLESCNENGATTEDDDADTCVTIRGEKIDCDEELDIDPNECPACMN